MRRTTLAVTLSAPLLVVALIAVLLLPARPVVAAAPNGSADYAALVELFETLSEWRRPPTVDGVPDYSPEWVQSKRAAVDALRETYDAMDVADWKVSQSVDYMLVGAQLNAADFELRVVRPS